MGKISVKPLGDQGTFTPRTRAPDDDPDLFHKNDLFSNGDNYRSNYLTKQAREKFSVHGIIVIKKYVKQIGKKNERNY